MLYIIWAMVFGIMIYQYNKLEEIDRKIDEIKELLEDN